MNSKPPRDFPLDFSTEDLDKSAEAVICNLEKYQAILEMDPGACGTDVEVILRQFLKIRSTYRRASDHVQKKPSKDDRWVINWYFLLLV